MKKQIAILFLSSICHFAQAQKTNQQIEDSILSFIQKNQDPKIQYQSYIKISKLYRGENIERELMYLEKAVFTAEETRDRVFMATSYIEVITILQNFAYFGKRYQSSLSLIERCLSISKEAQLNDKTALAYMKKAGAARIQGNMEEATKNNEEAISYASLCNNDSVKTVSEIGMANTLSAKDENLSAFKHYMRALEIAEIADNDQLKLNIYNRLTQFYNSIQQNEKAKDYGIKAIALAKKLGDMDAELSMYTTLMGLSMLEKNYVAAREYFNFYKERAKTSADDFHKQGVIINEINLAFSEDESKVPNFIRTNTQLIEQMRNWGFSTEMFKVYGMMHSIEKRYDSAEYYFRLCKQSIKPTDPPYFSKNFNDAYIGHLWRMNRKADAEKYLLENIELAKKMESLSGQKEARENLDSVYMLTNNKSLELQNKLLLYGLTDSLEKQQKAKDLLNIEIDAENKRKDRELEATKIEKAKKQNLQYLGITAAIFALFITLAALGRLKVKPWIIRAMGFLSFILLFEFIILLADHQIHEFTHGDVLQIFLIKIVLIAMLMPLHHWLEHKVVHFIMRHKHVETEIKKEVVAP
jgi:MalT-like TPR region